MEIFKQQRLLLFVLLISILPFILNLLGVDFASVSIDFLDSRSSLAEVTSDDKFHAIKGGMHHALLEWTAVSIALIAGFASFLHYYLYRDVSVPIIGLALLCAGFTDAFHTLAATRIISANVPNTDFIPFTWAFSRIFNASLMIAGVSISLWIGRQTAFANSFTGSNKANEGSEKSNFILLMIVASIFVGFAIISVIVAATSEALPKTTFPEALITRPYDVLPLALFFFSGALAFNWYKRSPSPLRYALLLSLIPEIITQVHMSFGSIALFDNHFNIAHGLKVVAYICLLTGILVSLLTNKGQLKDLKAGNFSDDFNDETVNLKRQFDHVRNTELLKVGSAKYPQTLTIPLFAFILAIAVTIVTSVTYFIDSNKLMSQQRLIQLEKKADFMEKLLQGIYIKSEHNIIFLTKTPPIQNIANAIENGEHESDKIWRSRLQTIFSGLLDSDGNYNSVRYIQLNTNSLNNQTVERELVKSYRLGGLVYETVSDQLKTDIPSYISQHKNDREGKVTFYNASFAETNTQDKSSILTLVIPIHSQRSGKMFGVLELNVNLNYFINSLELSSMIDRTLYIANSDGKITYKINHHTDETKQLLVDTYLQKISPELKQAMNLKKEKHSFFEKLHFDGEYSDVLLSGHYRVMRLQKTDSNNLMHLFIELDTASLTNELSNFRNRSLLLGGGLAVIALAFAVFASRRVTEPMQQIIRELMRYEYTGEVKQLPVKSTDEVGVFARVFHNMLTTQKLKDKELLQQKFAMDEHAIVSITDVKGTITYVNEKFCEISGFSYDELVGSNHRLLNSGYHGVTFFKDMYKILIKGQTFNDEICNKAKNGKLYWVQTTIVPVMNEEGKPESYVSIRTDITQSKMNALEIAETRDILSFQVTQLKEANADLDQFAYVASHDLKSPLNGIAQLVTWIDEDCHDLLPEESKEHLDLLKSRSKRMLHLLNDLLEYSRIGRDEHVKETLNLKECTKEIFELQGNRDGFTCTGQDVDFTLQRIPFEMALRNLISNAIKHHDKDKGHIDVAYELVKVNDKDMHQFKITDDGPGIPPDLQEKALEMFQTLQSRDETEGSGMGLAMVKKMAEKYEGSLQIESDGIRGTTFIVQWGV